MVRSFRRFGTILGVLAAVLFLGGARPASAQTVTFEGLGNGAQITNGYSGLNWDNMFTLDATGIDPSGYKNGIVSGNMVAYNGFANPASFSAGTPFVFNSVYLAGAWRNNLNVLVEGLSNGSVVRSQTVVVSALAPTLFTFNWSGINQVRFSSSGGTSAGFGPSAQQFVMDNLSVTTVPEPASLALALPGVLPLGLMALRRRKLKAPLA